MKWRKKPVVIEAFQMRYEELQELPDKEHWPAWLCQAWLDDILTFGNDGWEIKTLEGNHRITTNDFIIQGVKGELYPCKPDIFEATYEPAE